MQSFSLRALRARHRSRNFRGFSSLGHFQLQGEALEDRRLLSLTPQPALLKDVGGVSSSTPWGLVEMNGAIYFRANDGIHGQELWVTNGTEAGTHLVRDIAPGYGGSNIGQIWSFNGKLYFQAGDSASGQELWTSDGTEAGTVRVADLVPGPGGSQPEQLTLVGNSIFFTMLDPTSGYELWQTDGTEAGTVRVKTFGGAGYMPRYLTEMNGLLYFRAGGGAAGIELWQSDGTEAGTVQVKDIRAGSQSSNPSYLFNMNGTLYFSAEDTTGNDELWKSDGTAAGTTRVKDIYPGSTGSDINDLVELNGILYFGADTPAGRELFRSDGTEAGTWQVEEGTHTGSTGAYQLVAFNGAIYFQGSDAATGYELWKSDGTSAGTIRLTDIVPGPGSTNVAEIRGFGDTLYFSAGNIWKSNGTLEGTVPITDVVGGTVGYSYLTQLGDSLIFSGFDAAHGSELWITDGTQDGTHLLKDVNSGLTQSSSPREFTSAGNRYYFVADTVGSGRQIFTSDGTTAGTQLLKNLPPGANPTQLTNVNGTLYFLAYTEPNTQNGLIKTLWKSDGTEAGTVRVTDFWSSMTSPSLYGLYAANGKLFFAATDADNTVKLWTSDGTAAGTAPLANVILTTSLQRPDEPYSYSNAVVANNVFYFVVRGAQSSSIQELWRSDGSAAGTYKLVDLTDTATSLQDFELTAIGSAVYFIRRGQTAALWKTDGTVVGTSKVADLSSAPVRMIGTSGQVFYWIAGQNWELWRSNGTAAGTTLIQTFASPNSGDFTMSGGKAYFTVLNAAGAKELWVSNGTTAGTLLLKEISPPGGKFPATYLTDVLGTLNFLVGDEAEGTQTLWKTNGTVASTQPVVEFPQLPFSKITNLKSFTGTLLFSLDDGIHGAEPWILPRGPIVEPTIVAHRIFYNQSAWDGNSAAIQPALDNLAIAPKTPYFPGSGVAVFNNITNFSRGITGIMVDLTASGIHAGITAADFNFKVGNNNAPGSWAAAPAPSAVSVVLGGGTGGSDRVYVTWPSGSIKNKWLEVQLLATANTGLASPDIVFWGNKIGDSGTSSPAGLFETTSTDAAQVLGNIGGGKLLSDLRDYNRDGQVTSTDAAIVLANVGNIVRLNVGVGGPFAPEAAPALALEAADAAPFPASEAGVDRIDLNHIAVALAAPIRAGANAIGGFAPTVSLAAEGSGERHAGQPNLGALGEASYHPMSSRTRELSLELSLHASDLLEDESALDDDLLNQLLEHRA